MPTILHNFPVRADPARVFAALATGDGLAAWWTARSFGEQPMLGRTYRLWFGEAYDWQAVVSVCEPDRCFELAITDAMDDWRGTRVRFDLRADASVTTVEFRHEGWAAESDHFRVSSFCWAMYLRLLRRYVETGEVIPYAERLDA